jgi:hypothetical protein
MGKKSRLKLERTVAAPSTGTPSPAPAWAGLVVIVLGIGFILTSLNQMGALADYGHYRQLFQDNPEGYVHFRYFISWGARWLGLVFGIGLFFRKDFFRKALAFLSWGTIAAAYWKHPHAGFVRHIRILSEQMAAKGAPFSPESVIQYMQAWNVTWFTESAFAWICVAVIIACEICMALVVIFFLTRPPVKSLFR